MKLQKVSGVNGMHAATIPNSYVGRLLNKKSVFSSSDHIFGGLRQHSVATVWQDSGQHGTVLNLIGQKATMADMDGKMSRYELLGRSTAGSFFAECLLRAAGVEYDFTHVRRSDSGSAEFRAHNPLSRIPVLVTPDGRDIIESMAIFTHLVETFPQLAPPVGDPLRDSMWQQLAVLGTSLYPAMHRHHHTRYYVPEEMFDAVREYAAVDAARWWDYIEGQLSPYLAGKSPMAADFYLFMITRWAPDPDAMLAGRPRLAAFITAMRQNAIVGDVNESHGKARDF